METKWIRLINPAALGRVQVAASGSREDAWGSWVADDVGDMAQGGHTTMPGEALETKSGREMRLNDGAGDVAEPQWLLIGTRSGAVLAWTAACSPGVAWALALSPHSGAPSPPHWPGRLRRAPIGLGDWLDWAPGVVTQQLPRHAS